jgi:hypothetical protein
VKYPIVPCSPEIIPRVSNSLTGFEGNFFKVKVFTDCAQTALADRIAKPKIIFFILLFLLIITLY